MTQLKEQESIVLFCIPSGKLLDTYPPQLSLDFQHTQTGKTGAENNIVHYVSVLQKMSGHKNFTRLQIQLSVSC